MKSKYQRIDVEAGTSERFSPAKVLLQDASCWHGIHLEEWEGTSEDLPETVVLQTNALVLNCSGTSVRSEVRWSGASPLEKVLHPGGVSVFPELIPYRAISRGYFHGYLLAVDADALSEVGRTFGINHRVELRPSLGGQDPFLVQAALVLADDIRAGYPQGSLYGEVIAAGLLAHLVRRHAASVRSISTVARYGSLQQERIRQFVNDSLHEQLKLPELAAHLGMDVYAFARWFKSAFDLPPHRYVLQARIERAKAMLRATRLPLTDIALQCGFYSASHFSTVFKRSVGVTPTEYRTSVTS